MYRMVRRTRSCLHSIFDVLRCVCIARSVVVAGVLFPLDVVVCLVGWGGLVHISLCSVGLGGFIECVSPCVVMSISVSSYSFD